MLLNLVFGLVKDILISMKKYGVSRVIMMNSKRKESVVFRALFVVFYILTKSHYLGSLGR